MYVLRGPIYFISCLTQSTNTVPFPLSISPQKENIIHNAENQIFGHFFHFVLICSSKTFVWQLDSVDKCIIPIEILLNLQQYSC
jgi:hypothetical protein